MNGRAKQSLRFHGDHAVIACNIDVDIIDMGIVKWYIVMMLYSYFRMTHFTFYNLSSGIAFFKMLISFSVKYKFINNSDTKQF